MKKLDYFIYCIALIGLGFLVSCGSDSEEPIPCSEIEWEVTLTEKTDATCTTQGSFTIVVSAGGVAPYTYSLDGGTAQSTGSYDGLNPGIYAVVITDANDCQSTGNVEILLDGNTVAFSTATTDSGCGTTDGTITVSNETTTGTATFTYSIDGGAFGSSTSFTGLNRGFYTVTVKDGDDCETSTAVHVKSGISYSTSVAPIIDSKCAVTDCHVAGTGRQNFSVFSTIQANAAGIQSRTTGKSMPPSTSGTSLSDEEIELISCWVDDGAPDN